MKVRLIANTVFDPDIPGFLEEIGWEPEGFDGQSLAEFAGRACYQSWTRPNPKTATNQGYLENIIRIAHLSVIEHASVTFYLTGVSRSFSHELVRHRHLSYSQLSQRYVDESDTEFVTPPLVEGSPSAPEFDRIMEEYRENYAHLVERLTEQFPGLPRKEIRQAARAVLPNATETKIVVTGNYRAWWEVIQLRATVHADVEIRAVFIEILRQLQAEAPHIFNHFIISTIEDGTEVANLKA